MSQEDDQGQVSLLDKSYKSEEKITAIKVPINILPISRRGLAIHFVWLKLGAL